MSIVLYHNPRCSKSRAALAILKERGITPQIVEYHKHPLSEDALLAVLNKLDTPPGALLRDGDRGFAETGLSPDKNDPASVAAALARHPAFMQRPVLVNGDRARIGRPPEAILEIL